MNKVTLEITSEGWKTRIHVNGKTYKDDAVMHHKGRATHFNDIEEYPISGELYDALNSFFAFDVAQALISYEEETNESK
jgi:hypothetical protein